MARKETLGNFKLQNPEKPQNSNFSKVPGPQCERVQTSNRATIHGIRRGPPVAVARVCSLKFFWILDFEVWSF
jgi:hypothetical protein